MADRNIMLNELGELLNRYAAKFDTGRAYSDYGENHYAENNVRDILNKLMCWNLVNANAAKPNAPGVDLIDEERKICIQISSTVSEKKINKTKEACAQTCADEGWHLKMFFLSLDTETVEKLRQRDGLKYDEYDFNPKRDIWTLTWLKRQADDLENTRLEEFLAYCKQVLGKELCPAYDIPQPLYNNSQTQAFLDAWNGNLFLNDYDKYDENAGVNVPLSKVYETPQFLFGGNSRPLANPSLDEWIQNPEERKGMQLILGRPGGGKSTLMRWFVANYPGDPERDIFAYPCTSLRNVDWSSTNLYEEILKSIELDKENLSGIILILDGFDELTGVQNYQDSLQKLRSSYERTISRSHAASVLITCREGYVIPHEIGCRYITLLPLDKDGIDRFCDRFAQAGKTVVSSAKRNVLKQNREVFGVPLILYMVLALEIALDKDDSELTVYQKIFDPEQGGIYARCFQHKHYNKSAEYTGPESWKKHHTLSREMALWLARNGRKDLEIPKDQFDVLAKECGLSELEIAVDFYKQLRHTESSNTTIHFIHKTMFEFFLADAIMGVIKPYGASQLREPQAFCSELANLLKDFQLAGHPKSTIYLKAMLRPWFMGAHTEEYYLAWEREIFYHLEYGILNHPASKLILYYDKISFDRVCFFNLLFFLQQINDFRTPACKIGGTLSAGKSLGDLIRLFAWYSSYDNIMHERLDTFSMNLDNLDLRKADLRGADLRGADLRGADLRGADLSGADLSGADLRGADLRGVNLSQAKLAGAFLHGVQLDIEAIEKVKPVFHFISYLQSASYESILFTKKNLDCDTLTRIDFFRKLKTFEKTNKWT